MQARTFGKKATADDVMARRRAAFVASERSRTIEPAQPRYEQPMSPAESAQLAEQRLPQRTGTERSLLVAYLLWFLLGQISAHRFYLGAYRSAIVQAGCIFGGALIVIFESGSKSLSGLFIGLVAMLIGLAWLVVDLFLMPGLKARFDSQTARRDYSTIFA